jgi:hypothetical protein
VDGADGFPDPEAAARGDIAEEHMPTLGIVKSPTRHEAIVLLGSGTDPQYPYQVHCARSGDLWHGGIGGNGPGWSATEDAEEGGSLGVTTAWGEAPRGSRAAIVEFQGREHEVEVHNGFYLFAAWGVPDSPIPEHPVVRRFIT